MYIYILIFLLIAVPAHAVPDRILGTATGTGIPEEMTPEEAAALIGGGTDLPTDTITTSESAPLKIRGTGGQSTNGINIYQHSGGTPTWKCVIANVEGDCNIIVKIDSGNYWELQDSGGNSIIKIEPGASGAARFSLGANYRLIKSMWFGAGSLYGDGTCPSDPTVVQINSGPKIPTFICTDSNTSRLQSFVKMPDSWDAGTVTFTHVYIQTAADTGILNGDVACQARGNGEAPGTWGTEVAIDDAAVTGSNQNDMTTSAAVTCAGTPAAGDMLYWYYDLDTATTTAVATLHHVGFMMEYAVTSWSD